METKNIISTTVINKSVSPRTPGGISKSLLTPCRRLGLSRKWKKSGSSPFVSPLAATSSSNNDIERNTESRKRRYCTEEVQETETTNTRSNDKVDSIEFSNSIKVDIKTTPTRTTSPRKKCKTLLLTNECKEECKSPPQITEEANKEIVSKSVANHDLEKNTIRNDTKVLKLSRKNSKSKLNLSNNSAKDKPYYSDNITVESKNNVAELENMIDVSKNIKDISPNNLTKACMVVIRKKIFKSELTKDKPINNLKENNKITSQYLLDSDSDDIPLSNLNKKITSEEKIFKTQGNLTNKAIQVQSTLTENDDFVESKKLAVKKLEDKTTSTSGLKNKTHKFSKKLSKQVTVLQPKQSSQSSISCDEDDDFDFSGKRTILISKTYNKVTKPLKVKSTGSITQKDIDEITARIERKKNLLLAKAMTEETKELRDLIKKWQLGCQNALSELLELMKKKMPEQVMNYLEILQVLKIPPDLVGYDSENDCFNTPDDKNIILSGLKLE